MCSAKYPSILEESFGNQVSDEQEGNPDHDSCNTEQDRQSPVRECDYHCCLSNDESYQHSNENPKSSQSVLPVLSLVVHVP